MPNNSHIERLRSSIWTQSGVVTNDYNGMFTLTSGKGLLSEVAGVRTFLDFGPTYVRSDFIYDSSVCIYINDTTDIAAPSASGSLYGVNVRTVDSSNEIFTTKIQANDGSYFANLVPHMFTDINKTMSSPSVETQYSFKVDGVYYSDTSFSGVKGFYQRYFPTDTSYTSPYKNNYTENHSNKLLLMFDYSSIRNSTIISPDLKISIGKIGTDLSSFYIDNSNGLDNFKRLNQQELGQGRKDIFSPYLDIFVRPSYWYDYSYDFTLGESSNQMGIYETTSATNFNYATAWKIEYPQINGRIKEAYIKIYLPVIQDTSYYEALIAGTVSGVDWDSTPGEVNSYIEDAISYSSRIPQYQSIGKTIPDVENINGTDVGYIYFDLLGDRIIADDMMDKYHSSGINSLTFVLATTANTNTIVSSSTEEVETETYPLDLKSTTNNDQSLQKKIYTSLSDYQPHVYIYYIKPNIIVTTDPDSETNDFNCMEEVSPLLPTVETKTFYIRNILGGYCTFKFAFTPTYPTGVSILDSDLYSVIGRTYTLEDTSSKKFYMTFDLSSRQTIVGTANKSFSLYLDLTGDTNYVNQSDYRYKLFDASVSISDANYYTVKYNDTSRIYLKNWIELFNVANTAKIEDGNLLYTFTDSSVYGSNKQYSAKVVKNLSSDGGWKNFYIYSGEDKIYGYPYIVENKPLPYGKRYSIINDTCGLNSVGSGFTLLDFATSYYNNGGTYAEYKAYIKIPIPYMNFGDMRRLYNCKFYLTNRANSDISINLGYYIGDTSSNWVASSYCSSSSDIPYYNNLLYIHNNNTLFSPSNYTRTYSNYLNTFTITDKTFLNNIRKKMHEKNKFITFVLESPSVQNKTIEYFSNNYININSNYFCSRVTADQRFRPYMEFNFEKNFTSVGFI